MAIGDVSMSSQLADWATALKGDGLQMQIGVAVLKQIQDQQKQQAEALIKMMNQTPRPAASGVDLYA